MKMKILSFFLKEVIYVALRALEGHSKYQEHQRQNYFQSL